MTRRTRSSSNTSNFAESPKRLLRSQNHDAFLELPSQVRTSKRRQTISDSDGDKSKEQEEDLNKDDIDESTTHDTPKEKPEPDNDPSTSSVTTRRKSHLSLSEDEKPLRKPATEKTKVVEDQSDISKEESELSTIAAEYASRNLRSSGIKCDPDFYTLALELDVKRPRPNKPTPKKNQEEKVSSSKKVTISESAQNETTGKIESEKTKSPVKKQNKPVTISPPKQTPKKPPKPPVVIEEEESNSPPSLFEEEANTESDVYCFESDHVALRQNIDYHQLLQTVSLLEAQRKQALDDIEVLEKKREEALKDPLAFVEKLQNGVDVGLPQRQKIASLPKIEWGKYTSAYGTFSKVFLAKKWEAGQKKHGTRKKQINFKTGVPLSGQEFLSTKANKPRTKKFSVFWSVEEQRQLEELLRKYPSEANEFNRYRKIAAELENRTPLQVQSRVQKYFIKLAKAGLPIPGRLPNYDRFACNKKKAMRSRRHKDAELLKISTFFTKFHVPVRMQDKEDQDEESEDSDEEDGQGWTTNQDDEVSDEEDIPQELRFSDEYLEIMRLKKLRKEKLGIFQSNGTQKLAEHTGFECDMCQCNPIKGVRYHCIDCEGEDAVDLCQTCIQWKGKFENDLHKSNHRMEPVYKAETFADSDYTNFMSRTGEYNYLDPNYSASVQ